MVLHASLPTREAVPCDWTRSGSAGRERAGRCGQNEEFVARVGRGSSMSELSRQEGARLRRQRALR
jgi:hypothetical protein